MKEKKAAAIFRGKHVISIFNVFDNDITSSSEFI